MDISHNRFDLFISHHGSENHSLGFDTRKLARSIRDRLQEHARNQSAEASIFLDETDIQSRLQADISRAIIQTRGGGVALFLLTPNFFKQKWCVTELRAFLNLEKAHINPRIKFRFAVLQPLNRRPEDNTVLNQILQDEKVRTLVPELRQFSSSNHFPRNTGEDVGESCYVR